MGYTLLDPESGAGAYKISGGMSGGGVFDSWIGQLSSLPGWIGENLTSVLDAVEAVLDHTGGVGSFLGKVAGAISKIADFAKIVQQCTGVQIVEGLAVFLGGMLISAGLLGFYAAYFAIPVILMVIYSILMSLLMGAVLDSYVNKTCRGTP